MIGIDVMVVVVREGVMRRQNMCAPGGITP